MPAQDPDLANVRVPSNNYVHITPVSSWLHINNALKSISLQLRATVQVSIFIPTSTYIRYCNMYSITVLYSVKEDYCTVHSIILEIV